METNRQGEDNMTNENLRVTKSIRKGWALLVPESRHCEIEIVEWNTGDKDNYGRMRAAVDGHFTMVSVAALDAVIWVNEEGLLQRRQPNQIATALARMPDPRDGWVNDYLLVGPALITGSTDLEGDTLALSTGQIQELKNHLDKLVLAAWYLPEGSDSE